MLSKAGSAAGGSQATRAMEVSSSESGEAADEDGEHGGSELARECAPGIVDWDSVHESGRPQLACVPSLCDGDAAHSSTFGCWSASRESVGLGEAGMCRSRRGLLALGLRPRVAEATDVLWLHIVRHAPAKVHLRHLTGLGSASR